MKRYLSWECVISLVLSRHNENLKWWMLKPSDRPCHSSGMDQCYSSVLFRKEKKIHPRGLRACWPKRHERALALWLLFWYAFSPHPGPILCKRASQECCLSYLRSSLRSSDLSLFYLCRLFPSLSFSHHHSGFLFAILTT